MDATVAVPLGDLNSYKDEMTHNGCSCDLQKAFCGFVLDQPVPAVDQVFKVTCPECVEIGKRGLKAPGTCTVGDFQCIEYFINWK